MPTIAAGYLYGAVGFVHTGDGGLMSDWMRTLLGESHELVKGGPTLSRPTRRRPLREVVVVGRCKSCGALVYKPRRGPDPVYCSSRCRTRAHRAGLLDERVAGRAAR